MKKFLSLLLLFVLVQLSCLADTVTDILSGETFPKVGTTKYDKYSGIKATSDAVYSAWLSTGTTIYLGPSSTHYGIVSTTSGGVVDKIILQFEKGSDENQVDIYANNTGFESTDNLWNNTEERVNSITYDGKIEKYEINLEGKYKYVGIRPNKKGVSFTSISIVWNTNNSTSVAAPTFDVASTTFKDKFNVALAANNADRIIYTTDNSTPSSDNGTVYSTEIPITVSTTVKAIAIKGEKQSSVATQTYTLALPTPAISVVQTDASNGAFLISINANATAAEQILYTINGETPTIDNALIYSESFQVLQGSTIKAVSVGYDKATFSAEASRTISDIKPTEPTPIENKVFVKTDALYDNGAFLFLLEDNGKNYLLSTQETGNYIQALNVELGDEWIETSNENAYVAKAVNNQTDSYYLQPLNSDSYLAANASETNLYFSDKPNYWSYSNCMMVHELGRKFGIYNNSFRAYTYDKTVDVYEEAKSSAFSISSVNYSTYFTDHAFIMPVDVEGLIAIEDNNQIKFVSTYHNGDVVPANTAIIIKYVGTSPIADTRNFTYYISNSKKASPANNLLHGSLTEQVTDIQTPATYYILANDKDNGLGFYWKENDGAAFYNEANKCYLAIPKSMQSCKLSSFPFVDNGITKIQVVKEDSQNDKAPIFDLNGRRMQRVVKGGHTIYIQNGSVKLSK